ncbi:hypothetical protein IE077_003488 [Cardiosporidium cionae]|uniref:Uncharacterized protein n=1 Tax=Cardiosporidium cionae TaxID=476202 RepID=A0ABQ7J868_9APIC|nr:hypothetical protein IE077_003488 [Cardiosporidium cionae]|eukprot:KAF8820158.1 hypothetical protein IE077_003488 [Cardiosporidium cionae]
MDYPGFPLLFFSFVGEIFFVIFPLCSIGFCWKNSQKTVINLMSISDTAGRAMYRHESFCRKPSYSSSLNVRIAPSGSSAVFSLPFNESLRMHAGDYGNGYVVEGRYIKQITQKPILQFNFTTQSPSVEKPSTQAWNANSSSLIQRNDPFSIFHDEGPGKAEIGELDDEVLSFDSTTFWQNKLSEYQQQQKSALKDTKMDTEGFPLITEEQIERMDRDMLENELRSRGYSTAGSLWFLRLRLNQARQSGSRWTLGPENSTSELLNPSKLPLHKLEEHVKVHREFIMAIGKEEKSSNNISDIFARWNSRIRLARALRDPIGFMKGNSIPLNTAASDNTVEHIEERFEEEDLDSIERESEEFSDTPSEEIPKSYQMEEDFNAFGNANYFEPVDPDTESRKVEFLSNIENGLADHTVEDLASRFNVPIDFIGDVLCHGGASVPISLNVAVKNLVNLSVLWDLIEFVSVADPYDIVAFYSPETIGMLSSEFNISKNAMFQLCENLGIKLPFGENTCVNQDCYEALIRSLEVHANDSDTPYAVTVAI